MALKATELRIGNFVGMNLAEFPNNYFRVEEPARMNSKFTDGLYGFGESQFYSVDDMEGILLTEEWLRNLGFEIDMGYGIKQIDNDLRTTIYYLPDKWQIELGSRNNGMVAARFNLHYVHQLQNLYFTLTGKELHYSRARGKEKV